ncbi:phage head completion protein [Mesorhizobium sp. ASY16-5R]|uniref:hypothetical protein n=1 Tax=Mesorhizobium sp. ASY16-5R TaxID=3445772 RepID=UPI003FA15520
MSISDRLAVMVTRMLARDGFIAAIERQNTPGGDFASTAPSWVAVATVQAVWDNPRTFTKGVNDGAPASTITRKMTIAYRDDLKDPSSGVGLRVTVNGVVHNVISVGEIGARVGLRLLLDAGTEA